jgi:hypothetical protein
MFRFNRRKWIASALVCTGLCGGVSAAETAYHVGKVILVREMGKADQKCEIIKITEQPNGTIAYQVRNVETGKTLTVVDDRAKATGAFAKLLHSATSKVAPTEEPKPTNAALAADPNCTTGKSVAAKTAPEIQMPPPPPAPPRAAAHVTETTVTKPADAMTEVEMLIKVLKDALGPSEREIAAMKLCTGPHRTSNDVIQALVTAAKEDPAPTVRTCCVACLFGLASYAPEVMPVIRELQSDADKNVAKAAIQAMANLEKAAKP